MKLKMIFNPMAGRGRARKQIGRALAYLRERGADVDCVPSASPADLTRIAAESSREDWDRVVVCGGDGSLHLAVREFDLQRGTLALLPLGSGDDFAHVAGIPRSVIPACDAILFGRVREVDVATANGLRYLGVAGLGFDSEVAEYANENAKFLRGSLVYLYSIFRVLPRFTPRQVHMTTAAGTSAQEIMFACVGNSRQYGGGIRITPDAQIDDGLLDVCVVHKTSRAQLLKTLPRAYTGSHVKSPFVETSRGTQFTFESEHPMEVYADGERLTRTPVTFALAEGKLRIVVP
jgi:YegS/Rv2252/BmrU family lipid kinase